MSAPRRPSGAEIDRVLTLLGTDLALDYPGAAGWWEDADVATTTRRDIGDRPVDVAIASREQAADQLIANRLKTQRGELASLGHPDYGSRHHELIGEPNVERTRTMVKLHVLDALAREPRIEEVLECTVTAGTPARRGDVNIAVTVRLHRDPTPRNMVVPFSLVGPASQNREPQNRESGAGA